MSDILKPSPGHATTIEYGLAGNLPSVRADPAQMNQAVSSVVVNASEAIGDRPVVIRLTKETVHATRHFIDEAAFTPEVPEGDCVWIDIAGSSRSPSPRKPSLPM